MKGRYMDIAFRYLKRLPFATILAARHYGMDNITVPDSAKAGSKLCMAILRGDNTEAASFLKHGADINHRDDPDGWTPLIYAIYYGNESAIKLLLNAGANVSISDYAGRTPLMIAAICGKQELAKSLIDSGADVCAMDHAGKTALDFAVEYHQNQCYEFLKQYV